MCHSSDLGSIFIKPWYVCNTALATLRFESLYVSRIRLRDRNQWQYNITASGTLFAPSKIGQYNIAPEIKKIFVELCTSSIKVCTAKLISHLHNSSKGIQLLKTILGRFAISLSKMALFKRVWQKVKVLSRPLSCLFQITKNTSHQS